MFVKCRNVSFQNVSFPWLSHEPLKNNLFVLFIIVKMFMDFSERGKRERDRQLWRRNTGWLPPICTLTRGQTYKLVVYRDVPWPRIKPPHFWCIGRCSNQLRHTGQGFISSFLKRCILFLKFVPSLSLLEEFLLLY